MQQLIKQMSQRKLEKPYSIECQVLLDCREKTSGWLRFYKRRNWPRCYVVLHRGCVYIYDNEFGKKPLKSFSLTGYDKVIEEHNVPGKDGRHIFRIIKGRDSVIFAASSDDELKFWMKGFEVQRSIANVKDEQDINQAAAYDYPSFEFAENQGNDIEISPPPPPLPRRRISKQRIYENDNLPPDIPPRTCRHRMGAIKIHMRDLGKRPEVNSAPGGRHNSDTGLNSAEILSEAVTRSNSENCKDEFVLYLETEAGCEKYPVHIKKKTLSIDVKADNLADQQNTLSRHKRSLSSSASAQVKASGVTQEDVDNGYLEAIFQSEGKDNSFDIESDNNPQNDYDWCELEPYRSRSLVKQDVVHLKRNACHNYEDLLDAISPEQETYSQLWDETETNSFENSQSGKSHQGKSIADILRQSQLDSCDAIRKCLQTGVESHKKINIFMVGKKSSGKSSLTRRLLKEPITDVSSTNGMEVHVLKCKAKLDNGNWLVNEDRTVDQEIKSRLLNSVIETAKGKPREQKEETICMAEIASMTGNGEYTSDTDFSDFFDLSGLPDTALCDGNTAPIEVWDFAGDQESYHAHVPFFRNEAVYVLTTHIMEDGNRGNSEYDLDFWLEVIRCHCKQHSYDGNDNPPVVIVGTHLDQYQGSAIDAKRHLKRKVNAMLGNSNTKKHIRKFYVISNTNGTDDDFQCLRKDIIDISKKMPSWNEDKPLRWLELENTLSQEVSFGNPVVSKSKVIELALCNLETFQDDNEVEDFLNYHNKIGTLLYFEDLPDIIVLSAQWLADALKCIITADQFQSGIHTLSEFENFRTTGELTDNLIEEIFRRQPEDISCFKDDILKIMEKFNIIVRPKMLEPTTDDFEANYFVPSMIQTLAISTINESFYADSSKTSCFCFEFEFLPPSLVSQYLVTCARHFTVAKGPKNAEKISPFFYRDTGMFNIDDTGCTKLMVAHYRHVIQNQVWRWSNRDQHHFHFLQLTLVKILETLIEGKNITYTKKFKCKYTDYENVDGLVESKLIKAQGEYFCEEHGSSHNSGTIYSDWLHQDGPVGFTKEECFATILTIITLDILTDILYDLLSLNAPSVKPRGQCDITYLYAKIRTTNIHIPSKGFWGGAWSDLQISTDNIGDDIERIRLTRNDMQHLSHFSISEEQYYKKLNLIRKVVHRMEAHNNKGTSYSDRMKEVTKRQHDVHDLQKYKAKLSDELPRMKLKPSFKVIAGDGCTLQCKIIVPLPIGAEIYWVKIKDGHDETITVDESTKGKYSGAEVKHPSLTILKTTKEDEGYYSCRVTYPVDCAENDSVDIIWPKTFLHVR